MSALRALIFTEVHKTSGILMAVLQIIIIMCKTMPGIHLKFALEFGRLISC